MKNLILMFGLILLLSNCITTQPDFLLNSDFEDGKIGDWQGRGSSVLVVSEEAAYKGKFSLLAIGRTDHWHGPAIDLTNKIFFTGVYYISVWVKIRERQPASEMIMTIERSKSGATNWDRVTSSKAEAGEWINLTGNYQAKNEFDKISVYIESSNMVLEYYIDDFSVTVIENPQKTDVIVGEKTKTGIIGTDKSLPSLSEVYKEYFEIGTCVELNQFTGSEGELLLKHFSSLTAENIMKPQYMAPAENNFFFGNADKLIDYAQQNHKLVRGHTLLWHQQNAKWMYYDNDGNFVSKAVLLKRLETYIDTVVSRYKGKVYAWDVVNEVVDNDGLRKSEWLEIAGEEYIEKAFVYARRADPDAKLFINEYGSTDEGKRDNLFNLVKKLKDKSIPVDGLGLQFHISLEYPNLQTIDNALKKYSELGLEIHITEFDMSLNADPDLKVDEAPEDLLIRQAHRYKEIFEIFKRYENITNVTFWGFHDGHTWLTYFPVDKLDWPLIFDKDFNVKYAYWGLVDPSQLPEDVVIENKKNNFIAYAKKGTPVIDAVEDEIWDIAEDMNINIYVEGNGAYGVGKTLWDENNLYVFIGVQDDNLSKQSNNAWEQDTIEIFIDEKNNKSVDYLEDDVQYRLNFDNEYTFKGNPAEIESATVITDYGYNVEVRIPFRFLEPAIGVKLGFDLQINDDSGTGSRTSYAKWNDPTNESYRNTSGFGTLILGE